MRSRCSTDSLSVFGKNATRQNYQAICHLVSFLYITPQLAKYKKYRLLWYLIWAWDGRDAVAVEVHYSSLLRLQIFILSCLRCLWNGLSILELHKGIFCRANKTPFVLHRHCRLIKYSTAFTRWHLRLSTAPWNLPKILAEESKLRHCTYLPGER